MADRVPLNAAERCAAATACAAAALVVVPYLIDQAGGRFPPRLMLPIAIIGGALAWFRLRAGATRDAAQTSAGFATIVLAVLAWLLWISRPAFLPLGTGPDLTHHLQLVGFIEEHWRLVHDPAVERFLGEMVHYTPGSHLLAAYAGAWSGSNGLHALHPVMSASVALSIGFVFLIGVRALPSDVPRVPLAAAGALSLFASQTFLLGPFLEFSFVAQVVAQYFATAMWWAITIWHRDKAPEWSIVVGLLGAALFLTWPVLIGPPLLLLGIMALLPGARSLRSRIIGAGVAAALVGVVVALFLAGRTGWLQMAGTGGKTAVPAIGEYGWLFAGTSFAGAVLAMTRRDSRATALFGAAILLQAAALYATAVRAGNAPYMALKMFYLLLFVQAAGVTVALGALWQAVGRMAQRAPARSVPHAGGWLAWALALGVVAAVARPLAGAPRSLALVHAPAVSAPLEDAGRWARANVPAQCIEYLVADDETAYWLHLAVLGNPRMSARTGDNSTYELSDSLVRWLTPGGLPYAIADVPRLPRDIRGELDILQQFGTAAVVRRRGPSSCPER